MDKKVNIKQGFQKAAAFCKESVKKVGKRNWIIILSIAAIGGAVALNYALFSDPISTIGYGAGNMEDTYGAVDNQPTNTPAEGDSTYFATTVLARQKARDEALEVLQTVVDSAEALSDTKSQAFADISQIAKDIESEANIEALVSAKGFENCIAVVNGSTVNVIVKSDGLLESEIAQINEIVYEQSGVLPANIRIVEKAS